MKVTVPDIGDFTDVPVIEILVSAGDSVSAEDPLLTLESDKATMDVPSPADGTIGEIAVSVGDRVSEGDLLLTLEEGGGQEPEEEAAEEKPKEEAVKEPEEEEAKPPAQSGGPPASDVDADVRAQVVVLGGGPGGYSAAFRAADLGLRTILIERYETLGGVCLNVGCIPSKALLHVAKVMAEVEELAEHGVAFGEPKLDLDALRGWKESVVSRLTNGLAGMARQRHVEVITGVGRFASEHTIEVETADGTTTVGFEHAIIAAGSRSAAIPGLPDDERIVDSTGALELTELPDRLLVIGGGIIGLEMATVYDALGSKVTVVEMLDSLIPGCDPDLVRPLQKRIADRYEAILLGTSVAGVEAGDDGLKVSFAGDDAPEPQVFDRILVAVGRRPNGDGIGAEAAGVEVDERGFIGVDEQLRTNVSHIHAIGDIVGNPMLAHKASHEGHVAAEVIAGEDVAFDVKTIPSVAYTDPEVAWMGLTETEAKESGTVYEKVSFPWAASGRAIATGGDGGQTKLLFDPKSRRILGAGMVGPNAGELIAETTLALELGADAEDIALTVHPHPTLSESIGLAAEIATGSITDLPPPKRR